MTMTATPSTIAHLIALSAAPSLIDEDDTP
jgi:hypothetical protein